MATTDEERLLWRCVDRVSINSHSVYLCDYIHIISWEWNCKDMMRLGVIICSRDVDEEEEEKHDGVRNSATFPLTDWVWEWKIDKHGVYLLCITSHTQNRVHPTTREEGGLRFHRRKIRDQQWMSDEGWYGWVRFDYASKSVLRGGGNVSGLLSRRAVCVSKMHRAEKLNIGKSGRGLYNIYFWRIRIIIKLTGCYSWEQERLLLDGLWLNSWY